MPLQWRLTTLTVQWRQWNLPKVCCIFRVFVCLSSFSFPLSLLLRWPVTLQRKVIINMWRCRLQTDNLMTIARRNRRPHDLIQRLTAWRSRSCIVIGQKSNIGVVRKVIGLTGLYQTVDQSVCISVIDKRCFYTCRYHMASVSVKLLFLVSALLLLEGASAQGRSERKCRFVTTLRQGIFCQSLLMISLSVSQSVN